MRPLNKASRLLPIATVALLLGIAGCKSKNLPTFPSTTPSTPSVPSSGGIPSPTPSGIPTPSPSGQPSTPSSGKSGPSSPPSGPEAPSLPSPGLPDISGKSGGSSGSDVAKGPKGKKSGQKGKPGGEPGEQNPGENSGTSGSEAGDQQTAQSQAGDDLQKAGEQIAKAGSRDTDPLIPKVISDAEADTGDVFVDGSSGKSQNEEIVDFSEAGGSAEGTSQEKSGSVGGMEIPADLQEDVKRAQEAIAKAGGALQKAGEAVASAESDEELAAAEDMLSDARIAVILATQDIELLEDDLEGLPGYEGGDDPFQETSEALQQANIALVIATRSILIAKSGSAELANPGGGILVEGDGEVAALEDELDESLIIFDGQIGDAREAVLSSAPPPETGTIGVQRPDGQPGVMMDLPPEEESTDEPVEQTIARAEMPNLNQGDIPDAQGDDIVAQQLREAAMSEADPELQTKLWEEYKRYKEGL
tara:strand:- start:2890 stop:4317 length:1428 start_codon:yes stop_codon:yes gene_type:complete